VIYIALSLLILANITMAWLHAEKIEDGEKIEHGWWSLGYLVFAGLVSYLLSSWWLLVDSFLIRKVVFDTGLNLFRGKPLFYVSASTTSIIDRIHYKLFGDRSEIYMIVYLMGIVFISIFML
jgi:hypothetical protein